MWRILVNNEQIIFDGSISIVENSPIFSDQISNSLNFTIKDDDGGINRRIFGYLNKPAIDDNQTKELPCVIEAGSLIIYGTIVAKWQNNAFSCYFKESGDFWSAIKDKYLKDIAFDKVEFNQSKGHEAMISYVNAINNNADTSNFLFPFILIGENAPLDLGVKLTFSSINDISNDESDNTYIPWIPNFHLKFIFRQIFEKNGILIDEDAISNNELLKKILFPVNFLINEFELSPDIISTSNFMVGDVENTEEPIVTCIKPHNLLNYQIVKISHTGDGMQLANRYFQIELIKDENNVTDPFSFKLIGEDLTKFTAFKNLHKSTTDPTIVQYPPDVTEYDFLFEYNGSQHSSAHYLFADYDLIEGINSSNGHFVWVVSDDYEGYGYAILINGELNDMIWLTIPDVNLSTKTFKNLKFIDIPCDISKQLIGETYHVSITNIQQTGVLDLMGNLLSEVKEIDPKNHVPYQKINDFIKDCQKTFGIIPFVNGNNVKIKLLKDILASNEFEDISNFTTNITNIENPAITGYKLSFKDDGNDAFWSEKIKIHKLDEKYTICDPVQWKENLPVNGSNTDDIRLVIGENTWYVFNKSFLNADNNWKVLGYNLLDSLTGDQAYVKDTNFSPVLSDILGIQSNRFFIPKLDVPFACKNFPSDKQMAPRLLFWQGEKTLGSYPVSFTVYYASGEIYPFQGHGSPAADLSIRWDTEYGIIKHFLQEELHWQLNIRKDCIGTVLWPNRLMPNFDFAKKYRDRSIDYLVKSRKYTLDYKYERKVFNETELVKV